jgi:hypothetical protein
MAHIQLGGERSVKEGAGEWQRGNGGNELSAGCRGARLSLIETLLGTDDVRVARVERKRVVGCRLSLHDLLDLELPHLAITFLALVSARTTRSLTV